MARGDFPSAKQDQFMVRFPDGMRDRIREEAEKNNRSMNAEIVARLEQSFLTPSDEQVDSYIDDIIKQSVRRTAEAMVDVFVDAVAAKRFDNIDHSAMVEEIEQRQREIAGREADDE